MHADQELHRLRAAVDDCNGRLVALLQERAGLAAAIGRWKAAHGQAALDPAREAQMLEAIAAAAGDGPLDGPALQRVLTAVLAETRRLVEAEHRR
ncbi:MAG: chorismate mutase [Planctomycetes bacterium]|nr:chorismate mutase [Planctomycetota bacterium]